MFICLKIREPANNQLFLKFRFQSIIFLLAFAETLFVLSVKRKCRRYILVIFYTVMVKYYVIVDAKGTEPP